jgi:hypothetical protein
VGEVGAGPADGRRVDDGSHLLELVHQNPCKQVKLAKHKNSRKFSKKATFSPHFLKAPQHESTLYNQRLSGGFSKQ